jgi:hypothetical protein
MDMPYLVWSGAALAITDGTPGVEGEVNDAGAHLDTTNLSTVREAG